MGLEKLLEDTPESCYWIGFLMADGHFDRQGGSVSLKLSIRDRQHVNKISKILDSKVHIYKVDKRRYAVTAKRNKIICNLIMNKYSICNNKTKNPPIINILKDDLFIAFLIGFIDGDGHIENRTMGIEISCYKSWKNNLNHWFKRIWYLSGCEIVGGKTKIPKVILQTRICNYNGKVSTYARIRISNNKFCIFLKNKAIELNLPFLRRKWKRIKEKYSRQQSYAFKNEIIQMHKNGMTVYQIIKSGKIDAKMGYIYRVIRAYKHNKNLY